MWMTHLSLRSPKTFNGRYSTRKTTQYDGGTCYAARPATKLGRIPSGACSWAWVRKLCSSYVSGAIYRHSKVANDTSSWHQRYILLPSHRAHRIGRSHQHARTTSRSLQLRLLPPLLPHRHSERRTLGPTQDDDVRRGRSILLLLHHHHLHSIQ
jgi:hypothetical protein